MTLPEATPVHEAAMLQRDLARAEIQPFAWVVNQALSPIEVTDPVLRQRRAHEARYLREVAALAPRVALIPWTPSLANARGAARARSRPFTDGGYPRDYPFAREDALSRSSSAPQCSSRRSSARGSWGRAWPAGTSPSRSSPTRSPRARGSLP